jgi:nucleolar protein 14
MPPSQLKQLKASLRDNGVLGPQKSKKEKRQNAKTGVGAKNRNQREVALQAIRDRFNPFEIKAPNKSTKFDVTTRDGSSTAGGGARPGVTKSLGEERVGVFTFEDWDFPADLDFLAPCYPFERDEQS